MEETRAGSADWDMPADEEVLTAPSRLVTSGARARIPTAAGREAPVASRRFTLQLQAVAALRDGTRAGGDATGQHAVLLFIQQ